MRLRQAPWIALALLCGCESTPVREPLWSALPPGSEARIEVLVLMDLIHLVHPTGPDERIVMVDEDGDRPWLPTALAPGVPEEIRVKRHFGWWRDPVLCEHIRRNTIEGTLLAIGHTEDETVLVVRDDPFLPYEKGEYHEEEQVYERPPWAEEMGGILYAVSRITWRGPDEAVVEAAYYVNGLNAGGFEYTVRREDDSFVIVARERTWIS